MHVHDLLINGITSVKLVAVAARGLHVVGDHWTGDSIMSVILETSLGDLVIDLLVDDAPKSCEK